MPSGGEGVVIKDVQSEYNSEPLMFIDSFGELRLISAVPFKSCALCIAMLKAWFQNIFLNFYLLF